MASFPMQPGISFSCCILALFILMTGCQSKQSRIDEVETNALPRIDSIWSVYDSLTSNHLYKEMAERLFLGNEILKSPTLYVYAGWLYGKADMQEQAADCILLAIDYGMTDPNVLVEYELLDVVNRSSRWNKLESRLMDVHSQVSKIENFQVDAEPLFQFWDYFHAALKDTSEARKIFSNYILDGSAAIRDYYVLRYENLNNMYRQMISETPGHYHYTQSFLTADKLSTLEHDVRSALLRLLELYPEAVFPTVYIVPGLINSGGTVSESGLYLGGEMFVKSDDMPVNGLTEWQRGAISTTKAMQSMILHELMHFQQNYRDYNHHQNLIGKVIDEGVCDFLVELCTGTPKSSHALTYLEHPENLEFITGEFKQDMFTDDLSSWMYNGGTIKDRPADLGYALGYLICRSYYQKSQDKQQAIFNLLNTNDFQEIVRESDYGEVLTMK